MIGKTNGQIAGSDALAVPSIPFSVSTLTFSKTVYAQYYYLDGSDISLAIQNNYVVLKNHVLYNNGSDIYYSLNAVTISDISTLLSQIDISKLPNGKYYLNLVFVADSNISEDGIPKVNIPVTASYNTVINIQSPNISITSGIDDIISGQNITGSGRLYLIGLNKRFY